MTRNDDPTNRHSVERTIAALGAAGVPMDELTIDQGVAWLGRDRDAERRRADHNAAAIGDLERSLSELHIRLRQALGAESVAEAFERIAAQKRLLMESARRYQVMADALGDAYAALAMVAGAGVATHKFDWEGSQSEHRARGVKADLMTELRRWRDACVRARDAIVDKFGALALDPAKLGSVAVAAERRQVAEMRQAAERLRSQAAELDAEADRRNPR